MTDAAPLRILHLYPRELGINGDRGNVLVLATRARLRGFAASVLEWELGSTDLPDADIVVVGSGPLSAQRAVQPHLLVIAERLRRLADDGVPFLAVSGGMQLLGESVALVDGSTLEGAGVFPVATTLTPTRRVGNIVVDTPTGALVGYENHGSTLDVRGHETLGSVRRGFGNSGQGGGEGIRLGSLVGTHLGGPVLALNPLLADDILGRGLERLGRGSIDSDVSAPDVSAPGESAPGEPTLRQLDDWATRARAAIDPRPQRT